MFARIKKSGKHQYLQIVENRRDGKKTVQRVIATLGRMDQLQPKGISRLWYAPCPDFPKRSFWSCPGKAMFMLRQRRSDLL